MRFALIFTFLLSSFSCICQISQFSFDGSAGNELSLPPDSQPANGALSDISRGSGINPASSAGEFSSNNWSTSDLDLDDYYTFTISSNTGFDLTLTSLVLDERRSGSGVRNISVRTSLDGFGLDLATWNVPDNSGVRSQTVDLGAEFANLPVPTAIEFRIYGYDAESSSGTWWLDNIQLFGTIAAPDMDPPSIGSIEVLDANSINVIFDEGVSPSSAEDVLNYTLNNETNPTSAAIGTNTSKVTLTFTNAFEDEVENNLQVDNIEDLSGNILTNESAMFVFILISNANFKDIVINEIMADPTPEVGLPDAEYVELFNNSSKKINLQNYTLNGDLIIDSERTLLPGEYVVLTDDSNSDLFSGDLIEMVSMGALTNSGEQLTLRDEDNMVTIDSVNYDNSWYGDSDKSDGGYSIERIGPITPCGENFSWSASQNDLGGTPGSINSVMGIEVVPPSIEITMFQIIDNNTLQIDFNAEPFESIEAGNISIEELKIESLQSSTESDSIIINFTDDFLSGRFYDLTLIGISNCDGSIIEEMSILFGEGAVPQYNELIITEVMANPNESGGLPEAEYLEILNPTHKTISLIGLELSDASSSTTLPSALIFPGQLLILTPNSDVADLSPFGETLGVSSWPSLNNSGDVISLTVNNEIIFSLDYEDSWYKDPDKSLGGWSIEMIDPTNPCRGINNWTASVDPLGGTPGSINSVVGIEPGVPPSIEITMFQIIDNNTLQIDFNAEPFESIEAGNISIEELKIESLQSSTESDSIIINFTDNFMSGRFYDLTLIGISNCDGSIIEEMSLSFGEGAVPQYNELIITEVMANPNESGGLPEAEYLEIFNPTNKTISLSGVELSDASSSTALPSSLIAPNQLLILTPNSDVVDLSSFGETLGVSSWPSLNNAGDVISLSVNNEIIFSLDYNDSWYKDSDKSLGGWSIEMIDLTNPCGAINNWTASVDPLGGTPGIINSNDITNPDNMGPMLISAFAENKQVNLLFNEKLSPNIDLLELHIDPDLNIGTPVLIRPSDDMIVLPIADEIKHRVTYKITVSNLTDCLSNIIQQDRSQTTFVIPEVAIPLDLVINEVLFNPRPGGVDFVEIFNRSEKSINLKNWSIGNQQGDSVINQMKISEENLLLASNDFLLFTEDPTILKADYPASDESKFVTTNLPTLPNETGSILLINESDTVIDAFIYMEEFHLSLLNDFDGVSLERISVEGLTQDPSNWKSAASTVGFATPGLKNSQLLGTIDQSSSIIVSPKVIIPDNSGTADFTTINYEFQNGNNIATVSIFDAMGRPVRKLLENASIPAKGFITWDGTSDSFQKVRVGYYLIRFEIFDASGNVKTIQDQVVVGSRF